MEMERLKTMYSTKYGCNVSLVRTQNGSSEVLTLIKESRRPSVLLSKEYEFWSNGGKQISRYSGVRAIPTSTITTRDRKPISFDVFLTRNHVLKGKFLPDGTAMPVAGVSLNQKTSQSVENYVKKASDILLKLVDKKLTPMSKKLVNKSMNFIIWDGFSSIR